ncbi:extracellular dioxygenase [Apiospora rasikravindrae]|uniref:Extracellular dioxygenase n=1 Tax=Apiospora rasikravindrae TaxID=990691 RepID=A0ABR1U3N6_9PEZI
MHFTNALLGVLAATQVLAHPGHDVREEALARRTYLENAKRTDLSHCAAKLRARGHEQRGVQRRQALAAENAKRGIVQRAPSDINKTHLSTADFDQNTPLHDVFAVNASCVLSPEVTEGPYYVAGEFVRKDVTEKQAGVPLYIDIDILDVTTCDPVTDVWVEIWSCNATGVYSGVATGAAFKPAPENLNNTFLRGFQKVRRRRRRPVHLALPRPLRRPHPPRPRGRPPSATERANNTIADNTVSHLGQMYFDQDLLDRVEAIEPYASNTAGWTRNAQDWLLMQGLATSDPLMQYVLLGEKLEDGVLAWLSFGVNTTYSKQAFVAATYYEDGGKASPNQPFLE